ncbi:MAG: sigma-54-dependent Fis family transcriptional regulator [Calditrichaeota bacterium]|nr:MAG: sigma-54-dependent Fis family transcriptional regulator [Calditrichota bacterium]
MKSRRILIADDESSITEGLSALLELEGYKTRTANDGMETLELLEKQAFDLLLVDLKIPGRDGLEILKEVKRQELLTEVIIITGQGTISTAVEAMKAGAYDYLTKPVDPKRLRTIIPKALERRDLVAENRRLTEAVESLTRYEEMIGCHEKMQEVYRIIDAVANTTANVLITGESGTGKELVARAIHNKSGRAKGPFVAVNCSAFPRDILENELFGHEKGAFTGALNAKAGCFEMADHGTLFLDEIGEMAPDTQAKLLRALEERRFRRLGGTREIEVDVRVISATNRDVQKALKEGALREDLYFRLSVMDIEMPPLRERLSDLPLLLSTFLQKFNAQNGKQVNGFSEECLQLFRSYSWPGNVRELKNTVERAVILCNEETVQIHHLPRHILSAQAGPAQDTITLGKTLEEIEKEVIFKTLEKTNNNKTRAAKLLGISLKTMHNKLNKYFLEQETRDLKR